MVHDTVNITTVEVLGENRVAMTFDDGARRERDLSPLLTGPVFDDIRSNPDRFGGASVVLRHGPRSTSRRQAT